MRRRAAPVAVALAAAAFAVLAAGCSAKPNGTTPPQAGATTSSTAKTTTSLAPGPAGTWSKAIPVAAGANLSVVSCPSPGVCLAGSTTGQTYRLSFDEGVRPRDARALTGAQWRVLPVVRQRRFLPRPRRA